MFTNDPACPDDDALAALRADLASLATATERDGPWRSGAFARLAEHGLLAGFIATEDGGSGATEAALLETLSGVASACLTTALVLTQWASACRIIATGPADLRALLLPSLARGEAPGRLSPRERSVFKSVGTALEDLAAAMLVMEPAR